MLRTLLQIAMLAAGIGVAASTLDSQTTQKIASSIRDLGMVFRQSEVPGSREAASGMERAADMVQAATVTQARAEREPVRNAPPEGHTTHPKAFYNKMPDECHWEKIIDPSDGRVECSVKDRQRQARASSN